jgi:hypothetical protein
MTTKTDLLTPQQVADMLGVKTDTLEAWRGKRVGPAWVKLGDSKRSPVRYSQKVIDDYLKARTTT